MTQPTECERDKLRAGLYLLYYKYNTENNLDGLEKRDDLLLNLQADIVLVLDGFDCRDWAKDYAKPTIEDVELRAEAQSLSSGAVSERAEPRVGALRRLWFRLVR